MDSEAGNYVQEIDSGKQEINSGRLGNRGLGGGQVGLRIGAGEIFGELSFLDCGDAGASSSVYAEDEVVPSPVHRARSNRHTVTIPDAVIPHPGQRAPDLPPVLAHC